MKSLCSVLAGLLIFLSVPPPSLPKQELKTQNAGGPPARQTSPAGMKEGMACPLDPGGKEGRFALCRHCGCRMRVKKGDEEKTCTVCKCGKKQKECLYR